MTPAGAGPEQDEFQRRFLGTCMIVRLVSVLAAMIGMMGQVITAPVLACIVAVTCSSLGVLLFPRVAGFLARHPLACVLDVLLSLAVVAVLGVESPLVLATLSTALVVGLVFRPPIAAACAVVLVAGYYLVGIVSGGVPGGFMVTVGVPSLYVGLIVIGGTLRRTHRAQVLASSEAAESRASAAAADERARLAREMHDSVGKSLHGIALGAEALPALVQQRPESAAEFARELSDGARRAAAEARQILVRLRADQPDRPLAEVLHERCCTWSRRTGVSCDFTVGGVVDISTDARYEMLAILGEALENVSRHAAAASVEVTLTADDAGSVRLTVRDDGCGFDDSIEHHADGHFGLVGMRERAEAAGMSLDVVSSRGIGTTVTLERTRVRPLPSAEVIPSA